MIHAQSRIRLLLLALALLLLAATPTIASESEADDPVRVLFLSKSSGFQHSAIKRTDGHPSHVDTVLAQVAAERGFELEGLTVATPSLEDVYLSLVADDGGDTATGEGDGQP